MATLIDEDRATIWGVYMAQLSRRREAMGLTKTELRETIDAVDNWLDTADASIYQALPAEAQANLTASQVRDIFMLVLSKRHERQV